MSLLAEPLPALVWRGGALQVDAVGAAELSDGRPLVLCVVPQAFTPT